MKKVGLFFKRFLPAFIMLTLAFGILLVGRFLDNQNARILSAKNREVQNLNTEAERISMILKGKSEASVSPVSFLDASRVLNDDEIAEGFLESCFDWSNTGEYDTLYKDLYSVYGARGENVFFVIMPDGSRPTKRYKHPLDILAGVSVESFNSFVTRVYNNKYSYFSEVVLKVSTTDGEDHMVPFDFVYTIDGNGEFTDMKGYLSNQV